jgi:hypothetical protein
MPCEDKISLKIIGLVGVADTDPYFFCKGFLGGLEIKKRLFLKD